MTIAYLNPPQQERSRRRVELIQEAAREAIAAHGIDGFTTSQVAELAGCSVGIIYRYYADKWAILEDLHPGGYVNLTTLEEISSMPRGSVLLCRVDEVFWLPPTELAAPEDTPRLWIAAGYQTAFADDALLEWAPLRVLHHPERTTWGHR